MDAVQWCLLSWKRIRKTKTCIFNVLFFLMCGDCLICEMMRLARVPWLNLSPVCLSSLWTSSSSFQLKGQLVVEASFQVPSGTMCRRLWISYVNWNSFLELTLNCSFTLSVYFLITSLLSVWATLALPHWASLLWSRTIDGK